MNERSHDLGWGGERGGNWVRYGLTLDGAKDERCLSHAFFGALGGPRLKREGLECTFLSAFARIYST